MLRTYLFPSFISTLILLISNCSYAEEHTDEQQPATTQVTGFGTLGIAHSTSSQVDIVRDLSQSSGVGASGRTSLALDSNFGLQLDHRINDNTDVAAQLLARKADKDFVPELTWLYAAYMPNDRLKLRLGRVGFDVYMLADSRQVAYSYTWVRPPVDFFGSLIVSYFDGADAVLSFQDAQQGNYQVKLYAGFAQGKSYTGHADYDFSLDGSKILGAHLAYQRGAWSARLGYSQLLVRNEYASLVPLLGAFHTAPLNTLIPDAAQLSAELGMQNKRIRYLSAGLVYDAGPLQVQAMLSQTSTNSLNFPDSYAAFLSTSYRMGKWTPYATLSASRPVSTQIPLQPPANAPATVIQLFSDINNGIHSQRNGQSTLSLGLRLDLSDSSNLKLQIDHIRSKERLLVRKEAPDWNGRATLLSASYNFVF
ncbi:porin [Undibacterium sp. CY7W]|uniref:Porin n=1 Tax=Undibacterium rugosum TaxID=2762291 RepID=A0A923KZ73_9BURK|nr:porin [Undibacterium rugosum]MBC3935600.1 porin [Undibacterium rugosum]